MSSVANATLAPPNAILINSPPISSTGDKLENEIPQNPRAKHSESESDSDSETSSEEDTSDDDKRMADNPILKERLKQLDRYATPLGHKTQSPEQNAISGHYTTPLPLTDCIVNSGPLSSHGKSSGPSDVVDSSSTPSEYRSHQPSVLESPNPCSGPASLNTSVTPKHNFSPPYGIHGSSGGVSGPSSQHEQPIGTHFYSQLSSKFTRKSNDGPGCGYGTSFAGSCDARAAEEHNLDEEEDQEFSCDVCNAVYANRSSLRSHMKKHINHVAKRHQCDQCPYSTQYGKNLFKHIESMHSKSQTSHIQCEGCARYFGNEELLRDHECVSVQYNSYRCEECGRVFKTKLRLKYHADIHNPRKPYVCDVEGCDRAFRTPKYLKNHRDEFHRMQPKNYICPVEGCDLVFHRKTHLKRHIATHEDAEKKYHCQWPNCQRRFCSEETLNLHYRKHTGEKPFNCALCVFTCYNKPTLNEHYRLNHAKDSTIEGPYKSFNPPVCSPSSGTPGAGSINTYNFNSQLEPDPTTATTNIRCSSPVVPPTVRHRMADILESCGTQAPGPLDAEINGILDSLDKESDLPDLFTSSNFDFEPSGPESAQPYRNPSHALLNNQQNPIAYERAAALSSSVTNSGPEARFSSASPAVSGDNPNLSSLETTLATILADFQQADANNSTEEFEQVKSKALSVLPTFTTGENLDKQLTTTVQETLHSFLEQPPHVLRAIFHASRPFSREESYMVESLEHQLMDDSPLIAPTPPRRRGRRPKLQQQLQPYLQRIFDLEPGTAEAMAAHLVSAAQQERSVSFYTPTRPTTDFSRGRGRGRGCRIRGRAGRPLSLTLRLFPDGTASRTGLSDPVEYRRVSATGSIHRGCVMTRRARGGIRGRYRIDRPPTGVAPPFHSAMLGDSSLDEHSPTNELPPNAHPNPHRSQSHFFNQEHPEASYADRHPRHADHFIPDPLQSDEIDATSMRLRAIRKSTAESEEELDDLDEMDEADDETTEQYDEKDVLSQQSNHHPLPHRLNTGERPGGLGVNDLRKVVAHKSALYNAPDKGSVNQDTLGEMLEDLGVIVKRIGERAAARRQPCGEENPSVYAAQPLNLAEMPEDEQPADCSVASLLLNGSKLTRNRSDSVAPAIQLPSMAILASASVGTPTSTGDGSTPGCLSNAEVQGLSPHFSAGHSQHSTSGPGQHGSAEPLTPSMAMRQEHPNAPGQGATHATTPTSVGLRGDFKTNQSDYHRPAPMWSCESMCCPTTRENCSLTVDKSGYSRSPSCDGSVHRTSTNYQTEENGDNGQSYHPTDLSTRMMGYEDQSLSPHDSPGSPKGRPGGISPACGHDSNGTSMKSGVLPPYPRPLSSNTAAMDSLRSAVEAVDHLRSLSALGAKYTASLGGMSEDGRQVQSYQPLRLPGYQYAGRPTHSEDSPQPSSVGRADPGPSPPPQASSNNSGTNMFTPPHMPSALNNLLSRDQKSAENLMTSPLGLSTVGGGHCGSPNRGEFPVQTNPGSGGGFGGYSPYHPSSLSSRCSSRGRNETFHALGPAPASACSSASSSSSSARSYLQDIYQQREHQYQQQQQQHPQPPQSNFPHHNPKSPVHDLTTRQLLSEAAATAYAHGLGRCDSQSFMGGFPIGNSQASAHSPRANPYGHHHTGAGFGNPYGRYPTIPEAANYAQAEQSAAEHGFHATHLSGADFGSPSHTAPSTTNNNNTSGHNNSGHYMGHGSSVDPYQLYPSHLRQASSHVHHALSRSMEQQQQQQQHMQPQSAAAAAHLAHSIHEVSGLAAAYHAYHQYHQQQQQAGRHGLGIPQPPPQAPPGAHSHYNNLLNAQSRGYYPPGGPGGDEHHPFASPRDLGIYTAHSERRDPKSAYLAETYRESQATSGRFLF